jgi:hypothetical protein
LTLTQLPSTPQLALSLLSHHPRLQQAQVCARA